MVFVIMVIHPVKVTAVEQCDNVTTQKHILFLYNFNLQFKIIKINTVLRRTSRLPEFTKRLRKTPGY